MHITREDYFEAAVYADPQPTRKSTLSNSHESNGHNNESPNIQNEPHSTRSYNTDTNRTRKILYDPQIEALRLVAC